MANDWTKKASLKLELLIMEMMENQGYVSFEPIAQVLGYTPAACESRARRMELQFYKKIRVHTVTPEDIAKTKIQKADEYLMRKGVHYQLTPEHRA